MASHSLEEGRRQSGVARAAGAQRLPWREVRAIARTRARLALRRFGFSIRTTAEGKFAVLVAATLPLMARDLVRSSQRVALESSREGAAGILTMALFATVGAVALGSASTAVRSLALERGDEALRAFPAFRGALAVHHLLVESVGATALFMFSAFLLLYAPALWAVFPGPTAFLAVATALTVSVALGGASYRASIRWIEARPKSARAVHGITAAAALVGFVGMPILPKVLFKARPAWVEAVGGWLVQGFLPGLPTSLALGALLVGAALLVRRMTAETTRAPFAVIWNGLQTLSGGLYASCFSRSAGQEGRPTGAAFVTKDVFLPWVRRPSSLFTEALITVSLLTTGLVGAHLVGRGGGPDAHAGALSVLVAACLSVLALRAMHRGLGALGVEAPLLPLLRPALGFGRLWWFKVRSATMATLPHALACAAVLGLWAAGQGAASGAGPGLLALLCDVVVFPLVTVGAGFLFPSLEGAQGLVPGSTFVGRSVALVVLLYFVGTQAAVVFMTNTGALPPSVAVPTMVIAAGMAAVVGGVLSLAGVRRLRRVDL